MYKFNAKELDESTGYYYYGARYYDPAISIFLSVDPLAEKFPNWNPYHYVHNNPINLIDPTGMSAQDPPTGNTVLNEIVINVKKENVSGSAQGAHAISTDKGARFYGYRAEGQVEGNYGKVYGDISGFSGGYEGYTESGGVHGNASVYGIEAKAGVRGGTSTTNISLDANGHVFLAESSGDAGLYTGGSGKYGAELGVEAGAYAAKGEVQPSVSILGVKLGVTIGGSYGSAHIGGRGATIYDSNTNEFEASANAHIGLGAGLKVGFTLTNTKQEIYSSKQKRK